MPQGIGYPDRPARTGVKGGTEREIDALVAKGVDPQKARSLVEQANTQFPDRVMGPSRYAGQFVEPPPLGSLPFNLAMPSGYPLGVPIPPPATIPGSWAGSTFWPPPPATVPGPGRITSETLPGASADVLRLLSGDVLSQDVGYRPPSIPPPSIAGLAGGITQLPLNQRGGIPQFLGLPQPRPPFPTDGVHPFDYSQSATEAYGPLADPRILSQPAITGPTLPSPGSPPPPTVSPPPPTGDAGQYGVSADLSLIGLDDNFIDWLGWKYPEYEGLKDTEKVGVIGEYLSLVDKDGDPEKIVEKLPDMAWLMPAGRTESPGSWAGSTFWSPEGQVQSPPAGGAGSQLGGGPSIAGLAGDIAQLPLGQGGGIPPLTAPPFPADNIAAGLSSVLPPQREDILSSPPGLSTSQVGLGGGQGTQPPLVLGSRRIPPAPIVPGGGGLGPIGQSIQSQVDPVNFPATANEPASLGIPGVPGIPAAAPQRGGILQLLSSLLQQPNIQNLLGTAATAAIGGGGRRGAANVAAFQDTFQRGQELKRLGEETKREEEQRQFQNVLARRSAELAEEEDRRRERESQLQGALTKQEIRENAINLGVDSNDAEATAASLRASGQFNETAIGMAVRTAQSKIEEKIPVNILTREVAGEFQQEKLRRRPVSEMPAIPGATLQTPAQLEDFMETTLGMDELKAATAYRRQQIEAGEFELTGKRRDRVVDGLSYNIQQELMRDPTSLDTDRIGTKITQIIEGMEGQEIPDDVMHEALVRALDKETVSKNNRQTYSVNESIKALNHARIAEINMDAMTKASAAGNLFTEIPAAQQEKIFTIVEILNIVDKIKAVDSAGFVGRFDSLWGAGGELIGTLSPEHAEFRALVHSLRNILAKSRSGAAVTPEEMKNLLMELPHLKLTGATFDARLNTFRNTLVGALTARGTPYFPTGFSGESLLQNLRDPFSVGGGFQPGVVGAGPSGQPISSGAAAYLADRNLNPVAGDAPVAGANVPVPAPVPAPVPTLPGPPAPPPGSPRAPMSEGEAFLRKNFLSGNRQAAQPQAWTSTSLGESPLFQRGATIGGGTQKSLAELEELERLRQQEIQQNQQRRQQRRQQLR